MKNQLLVMCGLDSVLHDEMSSSFWFDWNRTPPGRRTPVPAENESSHGVGITVNWLAQEAGRLFPDLAAEALEG